MNIGYKMFDYSTKRVCGMEYRNAEMNSSEVIGKNLRNARKSLGMIQEEVSSILGIPRSAISQIETGKRRINSTELARLAKLYHKTISQLLEPEGVSSPDAQNG